MITAAAPIGSGMAATLPDTSIDATQASPPREVYLKLITDLRTSGRPRAALAHLDAFDAMHPRDAQAKILRGDCLVDVAQYDAAQNVYRSLLKSDQAAAAYSGLGRVAGLMDDWRGAAGFFGQAVQRAPVNASYVSDLGFALLRSGDVNDAVFRLRQAAELAPDNPTIRNNLILALDVSGDADSAKQLMARVKDPAERKEIATMRDTIRGTTTVAAATVAGPALASAAARR